MKKTIIALLSVVPMLASAGNLLTNGSFEDGLVGWEEQPSDLARPVAAIHYDSTAHYPTGAGEPIPVDDAVGSGAYGASGSRAAYFVDDAADPESLTQTVSLQAGVKYTFGFDIYIPANEAASSGDSTFSASIGGFEFATVDATDGPVQDWVHYQAYGIASSDGQADFILSFFSGPGASKDFVVDDVFFAAVDDALPPSDPDMTATPPVPEPETWALLAMGLVTVGVATRRGARDGRRLNYH